MKALGILAAIAVLGGGLYFLTRPKGPVLAAPNAPPSQDAGTAGNGIVAALARLGASAPRAITRSFPLYGGASAGTGAGGTIRAPDVRNGTALLDQAQASAINAGVGLGVSAAGGGLAGLASKIGGFFGSGSSASQNAAQAFDARQLAFGQNGAIDPNAPTATLLADQGRTVGDAYPDMVWNEIAPDTEVPDFGLSTLETVSGNTAADVFDGGSGVGAYAGENPFSWGAGDDWTAQESAVADFDTSSLGFEDGF